MWGQCVRNKSLIGGYMCQLWHMFIMQLCMKHKFLTSFLHFWASSPFGHLYFSRDSRKESLTRIIQTSFVYQMHINVLVKRLLKEWKVQAVLWKGIRHPTLDAGDRVLVKKVGIKDNHKLADIWVSTTYVVISQRILTTRGGSQDLKANTLPSRCNSCLLS